MASRKRICLLAASLATVLLTAESVIANDQNNIILVGMDKGEIVQVDNYFVDRYEFLVLASPPAFELAWIDEELSISVAKHVKISPQQNFALAGGPVLAADAWLFGVTTTNLLPGNAVLDLTKVTPSSLLADNYRLNYETAWRG